MDKIAVLIPCYNEEKTIEKVIRDAKAALPEATIYVYNNNSSDRTAEIAQKAGAVVRHEYKQGKGNVIRRMFQEIDAECYIMVDGDDTYPMENAREMADLVLSRNADMVVTRKRRCRRPPYMCTTTILRTARRKSRRRQGPLCGMSTSRGRAT